MFEYISKLIATGLVALATLFHPVQIPQDTPLAGAVNAVGGKQYYLSGSGVSSSATTITLTNFDVAGGTVDLTMDNFGTKGCGTIEPGHSTRQEFISFTGVTQNADDTATLTGVTRGLSPVSDYTASSTQQKAHAGGSSFVISNSPPCFYEGYLNLNNTATSTATLIFSSTTPPRYDLVPTNHALGTYVSTTSELATFALVNAISAAGCSTGTSSVTGCVRLATQLQSASSTFSAGTPTVLTSQYATSSPYTIGLWTPITRNDGKLSPLFIATTTSDNYVWGGTSRFNGVNLFTASTTLTATTSISATNKLSNALIINNIPYAFPSFEGASSTVLMTNGSGQLVWLKPTGNQYSYASTSSAGTIAPTVTYTSSSVSVPAGVLTASSTITVKGAYQCVSGGSSANNCTLTVSDTDANDYISYSISTAISRTDSVNFEATILANNSVSAQRSVISGMSVINNAPVTVTGANTTSVNWSAAKSFVIKLTTSSGTSNTSTLYPFSIIINP